MLTSMVAIDGPMEFQLLPRMNWYNTIERSPRFGFDDIVYKTVRYSRQTIVSGRNLWAVASIMNLPDEIDVRAALTALLSLTPSERESCFVERIPDNVY